MFKALIFDVDGVITDTEPVHTEAWLDTLEPLGIDFDEAEALANYTGLNDRDFLDAVGHIHHHHFSDADKSRLIDQKECATINLLEAGIPLLPGVAEFVAEASKKYLLAICSGANRGEIDFILHKLKWEKIFDPIIASDSVKHGKPNPEGYIRALEGLQERADEIIMPVNVLAIEDSPKGIAAAKAAGLKCAAVSNSFTVSDLKKADQIVSALADVDLIEPHQG